MLRLVCRGANNAEIAVALRMGARTVESHVSAILARSGVRDRAAAIVAAYDAGVQVPAAEPCRAPPRRPPAGASLSRSGTPR